MASYASLKKLYPDYLSLDVLRRVCKISPKSARYLIEHGIIPAIDTGKLTWRYKIKIDDVITYLKQREKMGSMIPPGAVSNREKSRKKAGLGVRKSFSQIVDPGHEYEVAGYFDHIYTDCDEILTTASFAAMTGLSRDTVLKLARAGTIKSVESSPIYLIPKQYLLDFVVTRRFLEARSNSELFNRILGGFEIWRNAK
jgi:hypothetical protein